MQLHTGVYRHRKTVCTESWRWEKNLLLLQGIKPMSAACRSDALPTILGKDPMKHSPPVFLFFLKWRWACASFPFFRLESVDVYKAPYAENPVCLAKVPSLSSDEDVDFVGVGCCLVGRALDHHAADADSISWCGKGFYFRRQLSVQALFWCLYTP